MRTPLAWSAGIGGRLMLRNVGGFGGAEAMDWIRRVSGAFHVGSRSRFDPANEIATAGVASDTASIAAATVPEYRTSSPMFGPWFTPEITMSGRSVRMVSMA